jgi:copper chaperone CopZ
MKTITVHIPNIHCQHCMMTIRRESGLVEGAEFVSGDVEAKTATFRIESEQALQSLRETLAEAGYPVED